MISTVGQGRIVLIHRVLGLCLLRLSLLRLSLLGLCLLGLCLLGPVGVPGSIFADETASPPESAPNEPQETDPSDWESWLRFRGLDTSPTDPAEERRLLEEMVLIQALAEEAVRLGLEQDAATKIELTRQQARAVQPIFQQQVREQVAEKITTEAVEARYQEIHEKASQKPKRIRLYNLFKRFPQNADAAAKAKIRDQMKRWRDEIHADPAAISTTFQTLAERESDSQTRFQKGLIGNVRAGMLKPAIDAVAMNMKAGELSAILEDTEGLTLLYCEQVLPASQRTEDEIRELARDQVEHQHWDAIWQTHQQSFIDEAETKIRADVLNAEAPDPRQALIDFRGGSLSLGEVLQLTRLDINALRTTPTANWMPRLERLLRHHMLLHRAEVSGHIDTALAQKLEWTRRQILTNKALAALVQERLGQLNEDDVRAHFEAHRSDFKRPPFFRIAVIALPVDNEDPRNAYTLGLDILDRLERGEIDFEAAARQYSSDPSAIHGGLLAWISRWNLPRRLGFNPLRQLLKMKVGERSDLVQDEATLWILELRAFEEGRLQTFEEARQAAENRLGQTRVEVLKEQILTEWTERIADRLPPSPNTPTRSE